MQSYKLPNHLLDKTNIEPEYYKNHIYHKVQEYTLIKCNELYKNRNIYITKYTSDGVKEIYKGYKIRTNNFTKFDSIILSEVANYYNRLLGSACVEHDNWILKTNLEESLPILLVRKKLKKNLLKYLKTSMHIKVGFESLFMHRRKWKLNLTAPMIHLS